MTTLNGDGTYKKNLRENASRPLHAANGVLFWKTTDYFDESPIMLDHEGGVHRRSRVYGKERSLLRPFFGTAS
jgi:hypothetical protein